MMNVSIKFVEVEHLSVNKFKCDHTLLFGAL